MENYLTPEGLEKLKSELNRLENVERRALAEKLNYAISFGDLKENAAYHQAKEQQGFLEGRVQELKAILASARVIQKTDCGKIQLGSAVVVSCGGTKQEFQVVDPQEADIFRGKLSYKSPLGGMLLGKTSGCAVILETPAGKVEYKILEVR